MAEKHPIDLSLLAENFSIQILEKCQHLEAWTTATFELSDFHQKLLDDIFEKTKRNISYFNEEELKVQLIGFLFYVSDLPVENQISVFYERPMKAEVNNHLLSVVADCLAASPMPFNKPKKPYFFLQEYKKGKGDDKDPEAQMLMAMLIAQHQNQDGKPIYGSYITGKNWRFTMLHGREYCYSRDFNAEEKPDLQQIVFVLRKLKDLILNR